MPVCSIACLLSRVVCVFFILRSGTVEEIEFEMSRTQKNKATSGHLVMTKVAVESFACIEQLGNRFVLFFSCSAFKLGSSQSQVGET